MGLARLSSASEVFLQSGLVAVLPRVLVFAGRANLPCAQCYVQSVCAGARNRDDSLHHAVNKVCSGIRSEGQLVAIRGTSLSIVNDLAANQFRLPRFQANIVHNA